MRRKSLTSPTGAKTRTYNLLRHQQNATFSRFFTRANRPFAAMVPWLMHTKRGKTPNPPARHGRADRKKITCSQTANRASCSPSPDALRLGSDGGICGRLALASAWYGLFFVRSRSAHHMPARCRLRLVDQLSFLPLVPAASSSATSTSTGKKSPSSTTFRFVALLSH